MYESDGDNMKPTKNIMEIVKKVEELMTTETIVSTYVDIGDFVIERWRDTAEIQYSGGLKDFSDVILFYLEKGFNRIEYVEIDDVMKIKIYKEGGD